MMPDSLRDRLEAAKLAGRKYDSGERIGYHFRTNEIAADVAIDVVAKYLRELVLAGDVLLNDVVDRILEVEPTVEDSVDNIQYDPACVMAWPGCESGAYNPNCCRWPKSCSCMISSAKLALRVDSWNRGLDRPIPLG